MSASIISTSTIASLYSLGSQVESAICPGSEGAGHAVKVLSRSQVHYPLVSVIRSVEQNCLHRRLAGGCASLDIHGIKFRLKGLL